MMHPGSDRGWGRAGTSSTGRQQMKVTVFGATGRIGGDVVRQALDAGHKVTAVVRDPARFDVNHPALEVSAVPVGPVPGGESFVNRRILLPLISVFAREVYADLAAMEDEIRRSSTEWTVVRPPKLVNKPLTGRYRTVIGGNVPRAYSISRADAAHAMLAMLDDPATIKQAVGIAY